MFLILQVRKSDIPILSSWVYSWIWNCLRCIQWYINTCLKKDFEEISVLVPFIETEQSQGPETLLGKEQIKLRLMRSIASLTAAYSTWHSGCVSLFHHCKLSGCLWINTVLLWVIYLCLLCLVFADHCLSLVKWPRNFMKAFKKKSNADLIALQMQDTVSVSLYDSL